eukprot:2911237-Rhodomonas_salina.1
MQYDIGGMASDSQAKTDEFGLFLFSLKDDKRKDHNMASVAFSVDWAQQSIYSLVQACFAGHTIILEGHPEGPGKHGIILTWSGSYIPYHFDRNMLLWYLKVKPPA